MPISLPISSNTTRQNILDFLDKGTATDRIRGKLVIDPKTKETHVELHLKPKGRPNPFNQLFGITRQKREAGVLGLKGAFKAAGVDADLVLGNLVTLERSVTVGEVRTNAHAEASAAQELLAAQKLANAAQLEEDGKMEVGGEIYTKIGLVGEGAFGQVWKARDDKTGEIVAIKCVPIEEETLRKVALREVEMMRRAGASGSPHVARLIGTSQDDNKQLRIAMEYLPMDMTKVASKLDHLAETNPELADAMRLKYLYQMGMGLQAVNDANLVHLDFKLENVMVDGNDVAKVIDFGTTQNAGKMVREADIENPRNQAPEIFMQREQKKGQRQKFTETLKVITHERAASAGHIAELTRLFDATSRFELKTTMDTFALGVAAFRLFFGENPFDHAVFSSAVENEMADYVQNPDAGLGVTGWLDQKYEKYGTNFSQHPMAGLIDALMQGDESKRLNLQAACEHIKLVAGKSMNQVMPKLAKLPDADAPKAIPALESIRPRMEADQKEAAALDQLDSLGKDLTKAQHELQDRAEDLGIEDVE